MSTMTAERVELMAIFKRCVGGAGRSPPVRSNSERIADLDREPRLRRVPFGASICRTSTALSWSRRTGPPLRDRSP